MRPLKKEKILVEANDGTYEEMEISYRPIEISDIIRITEWWCN